IGALDRGPLLLEVHAHRKALRQRHWRYGGQLRAGRAEIIAIVTAQEERVERVANAEGSGGRVDGREPVITPDVELRVSRLAQHAALQIWRSIGRGDPRRAIQHQPAEVQLALGAKRQSLDAIVPRQSPARWSRLELPRGLREIAEALRELFHFARGD